MNTLDVCTLTSVPFEGCIAKGQLLHKDSVLKIISHCHVLCHVPS